MGPEDQNVATLELKRQHLILYLLDKVDEGDWHGVSDAANDLRVLEAKHEYYFGIQRAASVRGSTVGDAPGISSGREPEWPRKDSPRADGPTDQIAVTEGHIGPRPRR